MDWLQIAILSMLQGLTEFLPVSSSAHLILVSVLTDWEDQGLTFDVALHLGSLSAVVLYFRHELLRMTGSWLRSLHDPTRADREARLAWSILWATIPVGLAGLLFRDLVEQGLRDPRIMAWSLIGFAVLLAWADWRGRGQRNEYQLGWRDILIIGCAQALALIPGTSRSGITMTAGLMLGMSREGAARYSFLLSIPVIVMAGGLETVTLVQAQTPVLWLPLLTGAVLSAISAYLCIHFFLAFIRRIGMMPFVAYRMVLGIALLLSFGI